MQAQGAQTFDKRRHFLARRQALHDVRRRRAGEGLEPHRGVRQDVSRARGDRRQGRLHQGRREGLDGRRRRDPQVLERQEQHVHRHDRGARGSRLGHVLDGAGPDHRRRGRQGHQVEGQQRGDPDGGREAQGRGGPQEPGANELPSQRRVPPRRQDIAEDGQASYVPLGPLSGPRQLLPRERLQLPHRRRGPSGPLVLPRVEHQVPELPSRQPPLLARPGQVRRGRPRRFRRRETRAGYDRL
mmetsp:Transcript_22531/g.42342  ORF Transcript_22531/g.42342 Transcript_22531/m.42342 type:complete len:242 (+) Transcript_22531:119-844(+)